ncbi:YdaS family helix-turn-helix protein [Aureimonas phyllosphaerae]|nr:YdaS family helix-turn-helix protein [Aureimonas phyllosphaerae]
MRDALRRAIRKAGGPSVIGLAAGISQQAVGQWEICPPLRVLIVERCSGVSRYELRPDLYPLEGAPGAAGHEMQAPNGAAA